MGMGSVGWIGDTGMERIGADRSGVDTRVAVVSLKKSHPFYLNLPLLLYIIVIMSYYGGWYHYGYF